MTRFIFHIGVHRHPAPFGPICAIVCLFVFTSRHTSASQVDLGSGSPIQAAENLPLRDDFLHPEFAGRSTRGGIWEIAAGVARVTQDDALYEKSKHGPSIWYHVPFGDAIIRFSYLSNGCRVFIFTVNDAGGHVFRFLTTTSGTDIRAWAPKAHRASPLWKGGPPLQSLVWTTVAVRLEGSRATVSIGKNPIATVVFPSLSRPKTTIGLGFAYGTLSLRGFSVVPCGQGLSRIRLLPQRCGST